MRRATRPLLRPAPVVAESRILAQILGHLQDTPGVVAWRSNTGMSHAAGGRKIRFGVPGQADITAIVHSPSLRVGVAVFIEVKSATGKQSADQIKFCKRVESVGAIYVLARTLEEAMTPVRVLLTPVDV